MAAPCSSWPISQRNAAKHPTHSAQDGSESLRTSPVDQRPRRPRFVLQQKGRYTVSFGERMDDHNVAPKPIEEAVAQAVQDVRQLRQRIAETNVADEQMWFQNLLCGILNCALADYRSVEIGAKNFVDLAAWGRRNLLELKVITEYVLVSEANAFELRNDLILDAKEFLEAISRSHTSLHKQYLPVLSALVSQEQGPLEIALEEVLRRESERGPQTAASDSAAELCKQFLSAMGVKVGATPKRTSTIAMLLGPDRAEDFDPLFKICSKLMHRTALSIASSTFQGSLDAIVPFLEYSAVSDLLSIYNRINRYVETMGVQLPAKQTP